MRLGHQTNNRGVVGHPAGVTSVKDLFYLSIGDTEQAIREVAAAGYAGVELFDGNLVEYPGGTEALSSLLDALGLRLVAVYSGANFLFQEILDEELWRIERAAEAAARVGAGHLVVGGGARRADGPRPGDFELLGHGLDRVVAIAERHGLAASFHPHLGTCVESRAEVGAALAHSTINLCPDTAHLAAGGSDNAELIRAYADRIVYVHLKDYTAEPFAFVPLGAGELELEPIVASLRDVGFDGWITVECDGYPGEPEAAAAASRRHLETLLSDAR